MPIMDYVYRSPVGPYLLHVNDGIFEVFSPLAADSRRIPLAWIVVSFRPQQNGDYSVDFGIMTGGAPPAQSVYGDVTLSLPNEFSIAFPQSQCAVELPRLQQFLTAAASTVGRTAG
jgi:hypothetical protein